MGVKGKSKWDDYFKKEQKINHWTVVDNSINILGKGYGRAHILVKCKCGKEKLIQVSNLISGKSTNCGCLTKYAKQNLSSNWTGIGKVPGKYFLQFRTSARNRNIFVNVENKYIANLFDKQNGKCALSNLPISFTDNTASLDRIDNSKGYVKGNLQWLHRDVNYSKRTLSEKRFIEICKAVTEAQKI